MSRPGLSTDVLEGASGGADPTQTDTFIAPTTEHDAAQEEPITSPVAATSTGLPGPICHLINDDEDTPHSQESLASQLGSLE